MLEKHPVVIITGGGRGVGYGIAQCFAAQHAVICLADIDEPTAREAATHLTEHGATEAFAIACDVADAASVQAMVDAVDQRCGGIDVLVNNAGICPFIDGMEMDEKTWRRTLDINLTGPFLCTQAVGRKMIARGRGGRIVSITSLSENVSGPQQVDYAASKAGLRMMTVSFATLLARHGITCNCVAPGMILTDMTRHHWEQPGPAEEIKQRVPVGRIGTPTDIGRAVVMLSSPEAQYINGITLRVDGGHQAVCN